MSILDVKTGIKKRPKLEQLKPPSVHHIMNLETFGPNMDQGIFFVEVNPSYFYHFFSSEILFLSLAAMINDCTLQRNLGFRFQNFRTRTILNCKKITTLMQHFLM